MLLIKRLSKDINKLIFSGNMYQLNISFLHVVPDEVMFDLNMLGHGVLGNILSD